MIPDTRPLTEPVDRAGLRSFRRKLPDAVRPSVAGVVGRSILLIGFPVLFLAMWLTLVDGTLVDDGEWDWAMTGLLVPYAVVPVLGIVLLVRALRRRSGVRQFRLNGFAEANGFGYESYAAPPTLPGMIFTRPGQSSAFVTDLLRRRTGQPLEIGNHTCVIGSGKNSSTYRWGYVAMRLPRALPHIVLDARGNNSLGHSSLPIAFAGEQQLSLEGDFDRYFSLYCPAGYEADALYLFSPDTMAVFVDSAARLDIEIVDDHLFLYAPGQLSTLDPETWEMLFATVETLSQRLDRWGRWRDDRIPAAGSMFPGQFDGDFVERSGGVARRGRRLSVKEDWWWVLAAAFAVFGLFSLVRQLIGALSG